MPQPRNEALELSVVIPCYGSASVLPDLLARLTKELESRKTAYEIILVNDCSTDNLADVVPELIKTFPALHYIELMYNIGQHRAVMCGLSRAKGHFIVTMDDDLQHPPEEIHKLIDRLKSDAGLDAVFGAYDIKHHSCIRNLGSRIIRHLNTVIFRKPRGLEMSAFRCLRRELVDALVMNKTHYPVIGPLLLKNTKRIVNVTVHHEPRHHGYSTYSTMRLIRTTLDNILNFSSLPLQVIAVIGVGVAALSFLISLAFIIGYLLKGSSVPGWTSLFLAMNFYAGLGLLAIGVIGEYLIRILGESKGEPLYIVRREMTGKDS